jgi:hypothetical protein
MHGRLPYMYKYFEGSHDDAKILGFMRPRD